MVLNLWGTCSSISFREGSLRHGLLRASKITETFRHGVNTIGTSLAESRASSCIWDPLLQEPRAVRWRWNRTACCKSSHMWCIMQHVVRSSWNTRCCRFDRCAMEQPRSVLTVVHERQVDDFTLHALNRTCLLMSNDALSKKTKFWSSWALLVLQEHVTLLRRGLAV